MPKVSKGKIDVESVKNALKSRRIHVCISDDVIKEILETEAQLENLDSICFFIKGRYEINLVDIIHQYIKTKKGLHFPINPAEIIATIKTYAPNISPDELNNCKFKSLTYTWGDVLNFMYPNYFSDIRISSSFDDSLDDLAAEIQRNIRLFGINYYFVSKIGDAAIDSITQKNENCPLTNEVPLPTYNLGILDYIRKLHPELDEVQSETILGAIIDVFDKLVDTVRTRHNSNDCTCKIMFDCDGQLLLFNFYHLMEYLTGKPVNRLSDEELAEIISEVKEKNSVGTSVLRDDRFKLLFLNLISSNDFFKILTEEAKFDYILMKLLEGASVGIISTCTGLSSEEIHNIVLLLLGVDDNGLFVEGPYKKTELRNYIIIQYEEHGDVNIISSQLGVSVDIIWNIINSYSNSCREVIEAKINGV